MDESTTDYDARIKEIIEALPGDVFVFVLWDVNADSWSGTRTFSGVYATFEAAYEQIPDNLKSLDRKPYGARQVANFAYREITIEPIQGAL